MDTIAQAQGENSAVLFLDPTHQTYNTVNGYCWQEIGQDNTKIVYSNSGRKRISIIGAINAIILNCYSKYV